MAVAKKKTAVKKAPAKKKAAVKKAPVKAKAVAKPVAVPTPEPVVEAKVEPNNRRLTGRN